jgi:hypothetical protein
MVENKTTSLDLDVISMSGRGRFDMILGLDFIAISMSIEQNMRSPSTQIIFRKF